MPEHRVVRSVDVRSVVRVAFALSLSVWGIAFVGLIALYLLGLVSGGLGGVEGFIASLGFTGFRLSILPFLGAFIVFAGVASALVAVVSGVLAHLYNSLHGLVGGVEIVSEERIGRVRQRAVPAPQTFDPRQDAGAPPYPPQEMPAPGEYAAGTVPPEGTSGEPR